MYKKWIYPLGLVLAGLLLFYFYQKYRVAPSIKLNELHLSDLEGKAVSMSQWKGQKVVLSFGASWCVNCWKELKELAKLDPSELADITVLVVSDEPIEKIKHFQEKGAFPFTFLKMNVPFSAIGIHSIPTSYIINTNLQITKETVGYIDWQDPSTREHLKKLME